MGVHIIWTIVFWGVFLSSTIGLLDGDMELFAHDWCGSYEM